MFKILFISGFLSVVDLVVQNELSLVILKNFNDIEEPAPSVLIIKNGKNISLTCQTVDKKKKNFFDNPVVWSKQTNHYNVSFKADGKNGPNNKIVDTTHPSKLSFMPVKIHDGGLYLCTNAKYNLSQRLQLIVRPHKPGKKPRGESRWKRNQYNYGAGYPGGTIEHQVPAIDNPDSVRDLLDSLRKINITQVGSDTKLYDSWQNNYPYSKPQLPQIHSITDLLDGHQKKNITQIGSDTKLYDDWRKNYLYPIPQVPQIDHLDSITDLLDDFRKKNITQVGSGEPQVPSIDLSDPTRDFLDRLRKINNYPYPKSQVPQIDRIDSTTDFYEGLRKKNVTQVGYGTKLYDWQNNYPYPKPQVPQIDRIESTTDFLGGLLKKNITQIGYGTKLYDWQNNYPYREHQVTSTDRPDPLKDIWDGFGKKNYTRVGPDTNLYDPWSKVDTSNFESNNEHYPYPSWRDVDNTNKYHSDWNTNDVLSNDNGRDTYYVPPVTEYRERSNGGYYFLPAAAILVLIGVLMCYVSRRKNATSRAVPVNVIPPATSTLRARRTVETENSSIPTPVPATRRGIENDIGTAFLISLITPVDINDNRGNTQPTHLDVPPSYDNTVRNPGYGSQDNPSAPLIGCDLPPSYDEALANLTTHANSPSAPPHYSSTTQPSDVTRAASQNVRNAPPVPQDDV